jgi:endogenous inhibitor of DNA gyrase (YacG/DUF329 family)
MKSPEPNFFAASTLFFFSKEARVAGNKIMTRKIVNCPYCGKTLPDGFWYWKSDETLANIKCPRCGTFSPWKDGLRHTKSGTVNRLLCKGSDTDFQSSYQPLNSKSRWPHHSGGEYDLFSCFLFNGSFHFRKA